MSDAPPPAEPPAANAAARYMSALHGIHQLCGDGTSRRIAAIRDRARNALGPMLCAEKAEQVCAVCHGDGYTGEGHSEAGCVACRVER